MIWWSEHTLEILEKVDEKCSYYFSLLGFLNFFYLQAKKEQIQKSLILLKIPLSATRTTHIMITTLLHIISLLLTNQCYFISTDKFIEFYTQLFNIVTTATEKVPTKYFNKSIVSLTRQFIRKEMIHFIRRIIP